MADYQGEYTGPQIDERLTLAGTAYQKPENGIPAEDLAQGVIPDVSGYAKSIDIPVEKGSGSNSVQQKGAGAVASGSISFAEGSHTKTQNEGEHAEGCYNKSNKASDTYGNAGNTQHSVGIGSGAASKNAFEIMQNGDIYVIGLGGYDGTNAGESGVQTLQSIIGDIVSRINTL